MALKIRIKDDKGVRTRYHAVKSYQLKDGKLEVTIKSWVNLETRQAEKDAEQANADALAYDTETDELRQRVDTLSSQLASGDDSVEQEVIELSNQLNDRATTTDRPNYADTVDRTYSEDKVTMDYFEPITLEAIYAKLTVEGSKYAGAETI